MRFDILHELPGRIRVHCRNVRLAPEYRLELQRWVDAHPSLINASLSARTGNLVVTYQPACDRQVILDRICQLDLFGVATIMEQPERNVPAVTTALSSATARVCVSGICKLLLPHPIQRLKQGWSMGRGLYNSAVAIREGRFAALLVMVGKIVLYHVLSFSVPVRIAVLAITCFVEHAIPSCNPTVAPPVLESAGREVECDIIRDAV